MLSFSSASWVGFAGVYAWFFSFACAFSLAFFLSVFLVVYGAVVLEVSGGRVVQGEVSFPAFSSKIQ